MVSGFMNTGKGIDPVIAAKNRAVASWAPVTDLHPRNIAAGLPRAAEVELVCVWMTTHA